MWKLQVLHDYEVYFSMLISFVFVLLFLTFICWCNDVGHSRVKTFVPLLPSLSLLRSLESKCS